jgi:predicted TIM-barrel fold metal-dependent hydrolase
VFFDFHTHAFPDKIANGAIAHLVELAEKTSGKGSFVPHTDGTLDGLKRSMARGGVDGSLVLPVCTSASQFDSVNKFAAEINGKDGIYSFGGIHPDCDNIEEKLDFIKSLGLKGIKLHPIYQRCKIEDERNLKIVEHCMKIGLYCVFHIGYDVVDPDGDYCSSVAFAKAYAPLFERYNEEAHPHIILAHLGGLTTLQDTFDHLCGLPIYLDTAYSLEQMPTDVIVKVIRSHGANRVLFATDSPWQSQRVCRERLASLPISKKEFEDISYGNAAKILGL